jgi:broad specificity phosphatase PhoE
MPNALPGSSAGSSAPSRRAGRLILVRHGDTAGSRSGQHTGRTDLPLLPDGEAAAAALAPLLAGVQPALVLTSPLARARRTCELAGLGDRAQVCEDLREWDYGDYEGRTTPEIRQERPGWDLWRDGAPGGERPEEVAARADRVIARARASGGDTLVFGHGHQLRVLCARWLGQPPEAGRHFVLGAAGIGVLGFEHDWPAVTRWNLQGTAVSL